MLQRLVQQNLQQTFSRETPKTDVPKTPETQPECPTEIQRLKEPVGEVIG